MSKKFNIEKTPVVAVMGHVDHGKTSILDAIRNTSVQAGEVGGITQNTRAHQVEFEGQKISFIDTPGHEAFADMRSRGARVTDIVLLVVAADDGVQPQTKQSIQFAKQSGVPIVIAINKIDLPNGNPDKVRQELSQHDVLVEQFGGDVINVEVSAKTGKNLNELLEAILLQAEILELKKHKVAQGSAEAVILESYLDKNKGPISLVLAKGGVINIGDYVIYPGKATKIRAIQSDVNVALPSLEEGDVGIIVGLDSVLPTGEVLLFSQDQKEAIKLAEGFEEAREEISEEKEDAKELVDDEALDFLSQMLQSNKEESDIKYLKIILKTDTQGTLEAVVQKLEEMGDDEVKVKILEASTGNITEKDVSHAKTAKGIVIGFQSTLPLDVEMIAKREKVLVRNYEIIYKLLEEIQMVLHSMLEPEEEIVEVAKAEVKQVFDLSDGSQVAGCKVIKGNVIKGYRCFVTRGDEEIGNGKIISLKQHKTEVKDVKKDQECGIILSGDIKFEQGDMIICYKVEKS